MATEAQILANRSNARKSTGPRTPEGKAAVAQNAVRHGLSGEQTVIAGEDLGEFEFHRDRMLAELDPIGEMETTLAERIVSLSWRLKRAERLQAVALDSLLAGQENDLSDKLCEGGDADGDSPLGRVLVRDFSDGRVLDRLSIYERRIENSLYRTMAELKRHRILQEVAANGVVALRRSLARDDGEEDVARFRRDAAFRDEAACEGPSCRVPVRAYPLPEEEKITPYGVTTNGDGQAARAAGTLDDPPCKTNPIPGVEEVPSSIRRVSSGGLPLQSSHFTRQTGGFDSRTPGD